MEKDKKKERILGIDPGYGRTGWGVVECEGSEFIHVAHGCIETGANDPFIDRLSELHQELHKIIKKYNPHCAGVEELFFFKNAKTAMKVGQARGVILLTLFQAGIKIHEFTPLQVKQSVVGYGRAEKQQIEKMVQLTLKMKEKPKPDDAADALAVAITCGATLKFKDLEKR
jgi:crossover junction endodeoxyribonuclease RuvC